MLANGDKDKQQQGGIKMMPVSNTSFEGLVPDHSADQLVKSDRCQRFLESLKEGSKTPQDMAEWGREQKVTEEQVHEMLWACSVKGLTTFKAYGWRLTSAGEIFVRRSDKSGSPMR